MKIKNAPKIATILNNVAWCPDLPFPIGQRMRVHLVVSSNTPSSRISVEAANYVEPNVEIVSKRTNKKQPQGYNLAYFSLWWSRMDREEAREAVESKLRHEDAGSSARLIGMLQGSDRRGRSDSTECDVPRKFETAQDAAL
jgi:hypothetical protein